MKKSILVIATALLSFLQINASNDKTNLNTSNSYSKFLENPTVQIFEWQVKTNLGHYSGTSSSAIKASNMIALVSKGEVILEKMIESYYIEESDLDLNTKRVYLWEVTSTNGHGTGYSASENAARRMINIVASGDIITSKIIISGLIK